MYCSWQPYPITPHPHPTLPHLGKNVCPLNYIACNITKDVTGVSYCSALLVVYFWQRNVFIKAESSFLFILPAQCDQFEKLHTIFHSSLNTTKEPIHIIVKGTPPQFSGSAGFFVFVCFLK